MENLENKAEKCASPKKETHQSLFYRLAETILKVRKYIGDLQPRVYEDFFLNRLKL